MELSRTIVDRRSDSTGCHKIGRLEFLPGVIWNSNLSEPLARKEKDGKSTRRLPFSDLTSQP